MDENIEDVEPRASPSRRNFTVRNNAARQVAVNFMPSRQLPYNTLRLRRSNSEHNALLEDEADAADSPDAAEKQADIIVREMEQHKRLMEDDPEAEELRKEALRDLPQGMTIKRNVRAKLSASVSLRSKRKPISVMKRLKYRISFAWKRGGDRLRDLVFSVELWYEAIRNIEGHFGSAVGSYFHFLRWLFVLNLTLAVFVLGFVVTPQALHDHSNSTDGGGFLDFVTGKGPFEDSLLFYGHYHDGDISPHGLLTYNMPFAYFFTMVTLYLLFFAVLCYRTAYSYRRNFIETARAGGLSHVFANKVFCGWDFDITSQHAAVLHAESIYNEFKELLSEQNKKQSETSRCVRIVQCLANAVMTALVVVAIAGLEFGFWHLLGLSGSGSSALWDLLVSAVFTAAVALCPLLFNFLVKLEYYKPRTAVYVTMARTWLLDVGTLMLLLVYWTSSDEQVLFFLWNRCWETSFGQEAYRLVLLDGFVSLFVLPTIEFVRAFIYKCKPMSMAAPEFNIAYNSLTLIYNQAVLWFGVIFCPLLVVAVATKFLLLFYVKRECAMRACQPARKVWRAAQTQTVLYMLVTLSLFATMFALGSLFFRGSSVDCGPFRSYSHVYRVVSEGLLGLSRRPTALAVFVFLSRPGVIAFLMLSLCVCVYYMRAKALAQHSMVEILRHMLLLQAKDKDFLLSAIAKVSNGEWMYSPKAEGEGVGTGVGEGEGGHTWRYVQEVRKPSNAAFQLETSRLSHAALERPRSCARVDDGDTDSSFSWQGSRTGLDNSL